MATCKTCKGVGSYALTERRGAGSAFMPGATVIEIVECPDCDHGYVMEDEFGEVLT